MSPVCVRICLFSKEGRSNALEQTPQGNRARSRGRARGVGPVVGSGRSPCDDPPEDEALLSPDTLLCSSSAAEGGELDRARESSDIDKSSGESAKYIFFNRNIHTVVDNHIAYN